MSNIRGLITDPLCSVAYTSTTLCRWLWIQKSIIKIIKKTLIENLHSEGMMNWSKRQIRQRSWLPGRIWHQSDCRTPTSRSSRLVGVNSQQRATKTITRMTKQGKKFKTVHSSALLNSTSSGQRLAKPMLNLEVWLLKHNSLLIWKFSNYPINMEKLRQAFENVFLTVQWPIGNGPP